MLFFYITCSTPYIHTITNKKYILNICFYKLFLTLFRIAFQIIKNITYEFM